MQPPSPWKRKTNIFRYANRPEILDEELESSSDEDDA
jgi:hypothetical protein